MGNGGVTGHESDESSEMLTIRGRKAEGRDIGLCLYKPPWLYVFFPFGR